MEKEFENLKRERLNDNEIKEIISNLNSLLCDYKDEVPEEVLSGISKDLFYKVRKNWWQGVFDSLGYIKELFLDSQQNALLIQEINDFFKKFGDGAFRQRLTTSEDIEEANNLIKKTIAFLESKIGN